MKSFQENMIEYKKQIQKGDIQQAYRGLMDYIMGLKTYLSKTHPDYNVSSTLYFGYMDMTYFSFFPDTLKSKKLKIGIVFVHESFRFEIWLFGYNKTIQTKYWKLIKESKWNTYHLVPTVK